MNLLPPPHSGERSEAVITLAVKWRSAENSGLEYSATRSLETRVYAISLHFSQVIQESGNQGASDSGRSDFMDVVERGVTTSPCEVFNWADFGPFIVSERP